MRIVVRDPFDFVDRLFELEDDSVEAIFPADEYEDGLFNVSCDERLANISVSSQKLAKMTDSSFDLCADNVRATGFLFDSAIIGSTLFRANAQAAIVVQECVWTGTVLDTRPGLSIVQLEPGAIGSTLQLADCWFVGNTVGEGHQIIGTQTISPAAFSTIEIARTAFINNEADHVIGAFSGDSITLRDCFIMVGGRRPVFLGATTPGARIEFADCTIITPSLRQVVTQWAAETLPGDFLPAVFKRCRILLAEDRPHAADLQLLETELRQMDLPNAEDLHNWLAHQEQKARVGAPVDREHLEQSLGLA
jgi:hypothetical protein